LSSVADRAGVAAQIHTQNGDSTMGGTEQTEGAPEARTPGSDQRTRERLRARARVPSCCAVPMPVQRTGDRQRSSCSAGAAVRLNCLTRPALLSKRLHRHDPSGVDGPDPSHGNVEVSFSQPAGSQEPSEHQHARTVILEALGQRPKTAVRNPNVPKPAPKLVTADRGPLPFEKPDDRGPPDLWVDERQQLLHVARLPG
jgi:hypothetical protein